MLGVVFIINLITITIIIITATTTTTQFYILTGMQIKYSSIIHKSVHSCACVTCLAWVHKIIGVFVVFGWLLFLCFCCCLFVGRSG